MDDTLNKKQNRKVTVFAIILSVVSIGLLIFGFTIVSSDKVVMLQSISNLSNKLNKSLDNNSSLINKIATSNDIGIRTNLNLDFNGVEASISIDFLENKSDKKSNLSFDASLNKVDMLGLDLTLNNDLAYFFIDDVTPRYYYTALEYMSFISSLSASDYDKIVSLLKEVVTDYMDNNEITSKKVEISYNGNNKKVNKLSYRIDKKTVLNIATNFINSIKKDKSLLENIASYMDITKDEFITSLEEIIKSFSDTEGDFEYYYSVYYYGFNKIVQYELEDVSTKTIFTYKIEDKESINLYQDGVNYLFLEFNKDKTQYNYNGYILSEEQQKINFNGSVLDNQFIFILDQEDVDVKLVVDTTNEEKDNIFINKIHMVIYQITDSGDKELGVVDLDSEYYFNKKVDVNINDSVDINEISEEDMIVIENNIMNHPIYQIITTIMGSINMDL